MNLYFILPFLVAVATWILSIQTTNIWLKIFSHFSIYYALVANLSTIVAIGISPSAQTVVRYDLGSFFLAYFLFMLGAMHPYRAALAELVPRKKLFTAATLMPNAALRFIPIFVIVLIRMEILSYLPF